MQWHLLRVNRTKVFDESNESFSTTFCSTDVTYCTTSPQYNVRNDVAADFDRRIATLRKWLWTYTILPDDPKVLRVAYWTGRDARSLPDCHTECAHWPSLTFRFWRHIFRNVQEKIVSKQTPWKTCKRNFAVTQSRHKTVWLSDCSPSLRPSRLFQ
jgi:hypothetical protein